MNDADDNDDVNDGDDDDGDDYDDDTVEYDDYDDYGDDDVDHSADWLFHREGRASLVTSFGIFKYMAGYSMTQFLIVCIITWPVVSSIHDPE